MALESRARSPIPQWPGRPWAGTWPALAVALIVVAGTGFTRLAISQWEAYQANAYDLAIFDQVIWNTARGNWFETSFVSYGSYLGQHFSPILVLFAPLYWLGAGPAALTVLQAVGAAAAAIPLYIAGRRWRLSGAAAASLVAAYLLNPYLHRAVAFDFHPETLIALPVFGSVVAVATGRPWLAAAIAATTLAFKEDSVFVALALAAVLFAAGARRPAAVLAALAVAWALISVLVIMPWLRDGAPNDLLPRYGYLAPAATTEPELVRHALTHPGVVVSALWDGRWWTMCLFVLASAPLAVVRPGWLLLALPGLVLAALSSYESQRELQAHYAVQAVPLVLLALLIAARSAVEKVRPEFLAPAIILPALAGFFCLSPLSPFSAGEASPSQRHRDALDAAVAMVPADAPVSAQSAIVPRLSQRPLIEEFPGRGSQVDWVVVDAFGSRSTGSLDAGFWDALSQLRTQFVLVWEQDGVEVYRNPLTTFR